MRNRVWGVLVVLWFVGIGCGPDLGHDDDSGGGDEPAGCPTGDEVYSWAQAGCYWQYQCRREQFDENYSSFNACVSNWINVKYDDIARFSCDCERGQLAFSNCMNSLSCSEVLDNPSIPEECDYLYEVAVDYCGG